MASVRRSGRSFPGDSTLGASTLGASTLGPLKLGASTLGARVAVAHEEKRKSIWSDRLGTGTLACAGCDAPIAIGSEPISLADELSCPFCETRGPARDFLSLAPPTRPARVLVRVTIRSGQPVG
jgi:hypothetical protein